jgi:hypothetical protein
MALCQWVSDVRGVEYKAREEWSFKVRYGTMYGMVWYIVWFGLVWFGLGSSRTYYVVFAVIRMTAMTAGHPSYPSGEGKRAGLQASHVASLAEVRLHRE